MQCTVLADNQDTWAQTFPTFECIISSILCPDLSSLQSLSSLTADPLFLIKI
jgi:hypothetical protein